MEATESPLDVLSRAATMIQENQESLSHSNDVAKDCSNSNPNKHLTKWKRERRSRLPEYSRTTTPANGDEPDAAVAAAANGFATRAKETPLDMSVRQRGLPPSYAQTVSNPGYRSNYRPPAPPPAPAPKEEIPAGISMCDPIIDEHFRRSLGENYQTLMLNNNVTKDAAAPPKSSPSPPRQSQPSPERVVNIEDLMDSSGMSVDDHFAKALGETWVKLNKNKQEIKNNTSDNQNVVSI